MPCKLSWLTLQKRIRSVFVFMLKDGNGKKITYRQPLRHPLVQRKESRKVHRNMHLNSNANVS